METTLLLIILIALALILVLLVYVVDRLMALEKLTLNLPSFGGRLRRPRVMVIRTLAASPGNSSGMA